MTLIRLARLTFEAYHFGPGKQIFCAYQPVEENAEDIAVVLCPPLFHEYYKVHFTLKQLADSLWSSGYCSLRFDYRGCGDSLGESEHCSVATWMDDICTAVEELRNRSGIQNVALFGVRFSSSLILSSGTEFHRLLVWDPVFDGKTYAENLVHQQHNLVRQHPLMSDSDSTNVIEREILGRRYHTDMRKNISLICHDATASNLSRKGRLSTFETKTNWLSLSVQMLHVPDLIQDIVKSLKF
jgi:hypothetical protein